MSLKDKFKKEKKPKKEKKRRIKFRNRRHIRRASVIISHFWNSMLVAAILALLWNIIIETASRHSLIECFGYMIHSPVVFLINWLIIFATLSITTLFKRRMFFFTIISALWLILATINGVILSRRMTPFTVNDMGELKDGLSIVTNYMPIWELVLLVLAIALVFFGLVMLFIHGPKKRTPVNHKRNLTVVLLVIAITFGAVSGAIQVGILDSFFDNLAYAYEDNGVPYGFIVTWVDTGISKPHGYTAADVEGVFDDGELKSLEESAKNFNIDDKPNIIFLQLESFISPDVFKNINTSEEATPYWNSLMKDCSSGLLTVPAVGAGTANTEFEAITGVSAKFFGPGEYPYKSVLTEKTLESIPYDLKALGYSTHAIHNHRAVFYNRNTVFANLGFDTFTSLEYMNDVEKTPKNWAKDGILTGEILTALESTPGKDYIYTISVQGHGQYPEVPMIQDPAITVTGDVTTSEKWQYEYYVNEIHEMDAFVKDLTKALSGFDEDVILVMYGDHLPALHIEQKNLTTDNLYKTQYVVWSNYDMPVEKVNIKAYQLGAEVLNRAGIHAGTLVTFNQNHRKDKDYLSELEKLSYDMLYGKQYIYGGESPFKPTDIKMGIKTIEIEEIVKIGGRYYIKGHNFTPYSKVTHDGETVETTFLGSEILAIEEKVDPSIADELKVSQVEKNNEILSTTE